MKNLFVPYELALQLREKNFDYWCISAYRNTDGEKKLMGFSKWKNFESHHNHDGFCAAPLYQQVIDWFGDKHKLIIDDLVYYSYNHQRWAIANTNHPDRENDVLSVFFNSRYEAYDKSIEEALKLIKG